MQGILTPKILTDTARQMVRRSEHAGSGPWAEFSSLAQATDEELLRGHSAAHIAAVDRGWGSGGTPAGGVEAEALPQDIFVSGGTPLAARLAAGCVIEVPHAHQVLLDSIAIPEGLSLVSYTITGGEDSVPTFHRSID